MAALRSAMGGIPEERPRPAWRPRRPERPVEPWSAAEEEDPRIHRLTPGQYELWIIYLKEQMRSDLDEAEKHSDAWERRKASIERDIERTRGAVDAAILRSRSREDIVLGDEMDAWSFFQRRALLYAGVLQAEMATRLGGFGL